jgi:hypothetical protein
MDCRAESEIVERGLNFIYDICVKGIRLLVDKSIRMHVLIYQ